MDKLTRATPERLPSADKLRLRLSHARVMETRAWQRYDRAKNDATGILRRRWRKWQQERSRIEGQIDRRAAREAEVQRIVRQTYPNA